MNGKIKTKFAALFAVALMITVCVVPVVGNEDVQAADVSSTIPEGISDIEIQFFTEDSTDFSDMVYCSNEIKELPETVDPTEWKYNGGLWININEDSEYFGQFLRYGQTGLTNEQIIDMSKGTDSTTNQPYKWLPMIQISWKQSETVSLAIDINGLNKVTAAPTLTGFDNIAFEEREFVSTIKLLNENATPNMGCASKQAATGKYDVSMKVDGQVVSEKTIEYYPEAYNVTGYVGNASMTSSSDTTNIIKDKKVTVSYTVNGNAGTVKTDKNGKYQINFAKGSVVAITGITYEGGAYTFDAAYNFGTLVENDSRDFKANEKVGSLKIQDDAATSIKDATITLGWYYQYSSGTGAEKKYIISSSAPQGYTAGTVAVLGPSDSNGINFTYKEPVKGDDVTAPADYSAILINTGAPAATGFTFNYVSIVSGTTADLDDQLTQANGVLGFVTAGSTTSMTTPLKANETLGSMVIKSPTTSGFIGIEGATVSLGWYYQSPIANSSSQKYTISSTVPDVYNAGTVTVLGSSDKDGNIYFTYVLPTTKSGVASTSGYDYALINTSAPNATGYSFVYKAITSGTEETLANSFNDGIVKCNATGANIASKEKTYLIKGGSVDGKDITGIKAVNGKYPDVTINYTNGVKSSVVVKTTDGKYDFSLKVIEGNSCVVTPSLNGYTFSPASFTTNSAYADITLPVFVAESTADVVEFVNVSVLKDGAPTPSTKIKALGFESTFDGIVTFKYSVDGKQYVTPVKATGGSASLEIFGEDGAVVVLDEVSAEGYFISVDSGVASVKGTDVDTYYFYNGSTLNPVAGFEVEIFGLDSYNKKVSLGTIVSDENGLASLERDKTITFEDAIYNGIIKISETASTNAQASYNFDVSTYVAAETFDVEIEFISAVNSSDVDGFVAGVPISGMTANTFTAIADSTVALKAPLIDGFEFVAWMVDGVVVSENADYTLKVDGDCHVDALYSAVHYEEPAEGLSMNVLVIGIVILILGILAVAYGIISKKQ